MSEDLHISLAAPAVLQQRLADRLRAVRVMAGIKQSTLAIRAGVSLASLRLFEQRGEISLKHLLRLCHALGRLNDFDHLFHLPVATTMAELESRAATPARKRGRR